MVRGAFFERSIDRWILIRLGSELSKPSSGSKGSAQTYPPESIIALSVAIFACRHLVPISFSFSCSLPACPVVSVGLAGSVVAAAAFVRPSAPARIVRRLGAGAPPRPPKTNPRWPRCGAKFVQSRRPLVAWSKRLCRGLARSESATPPSQLVASRRFLVRVSAWATTRPVALGRFGRSRKSNITIAG